MPNIKISSLEETKLNNPDASFVMIVAKDDASNLYKNYRISLTELRNIIGSIEGDIVAGVTEEQVRSIVNNAISTDNLKDHIETVVPDVIPEVLPEVIPNILPETKIEVTSGSLESPTTVKVVEVAEKAIVNEIEITKIKKVTEDCVCYKHADECFNAIFN